MRILELIESIARERCIDEQSVRFVLESIIKQFAVNRYGNEDLIHVTLDDSGGFEVFINQTVVEHEPYHAGEINIQKALMRKESARLGDTMKEILPLKIGKIEIDRILSSLKDRLNELQKAKEFESFKDSIGKILVGYVKSVDAHEAILTFPEGEGVLKRTEMLKTDTIRVGSYIKVLLKDIRRGRGMQLLLSRTNERFLHELFVMEVPEIKDGEIEIKSVARDAGSLSKVAVHAVKATNISPIKSCIGAYGSRIQAVNKELMGEKISIVEWSSDIHQFIANALSPATVLKVIPKNGGRYDVVVAQDQFSKAMGRGGQNVMLAKKLCGVASIKLLTNEQEAELYQSRVKSIVERFSSMLGIEEMMAHVLLSHGFKVIEEIVECENQRIASIDGFDEDLATALKDRAVEALNNIKQKIKEDLAQNGYSGSILDVRGLSIDHLHKLFENAIFEKEDIAMLDSGELKNIFNNDEDLYLTFEQAGDVIANARGINRRE
jgi:N utilization substance protein A